MGLVKYLMNGDSRRSLVKLNKMADQVEALEPKYQVMDDETLKSQTQVLKDRLAKGETLDDILFDAFAALLRQKFKVNEILDESKHREDNPNPNYRPPMGGSHQ